MQCMKHTTEPNVFQESVRDVYKHATGAVKHDVGVRGNPIGFINAQTTIYFLSVTY